MGCKTCGGPIPVSTGRGRPRQYCSDCSPTRERPERRQPVVALPGVPTGGRIEAATRDELVAAGRQDTSDGVVALHLAQLIDGGQYNAQGAAALAKAHAEAMTRATKGAAREADTVDELKARRVGRRGA